MSAQSRRLCVSAAFAACCMADAALCADALHLRYGAGTPTPVVDIQAVGRSVVAREPGGRLLWVWSVDARNASTVADNSHTPCQGVVELTLLRDDADGDGRIAHADDAARLYVSSSSNVRGTDTALLTALDLRHPAAPALLWTRDAHTLPRLGVPAAGVSTGRIRMAGRNTDPRHHVLIFGAGLPRGDAPVREGRLFMLDALDGRQLWTGAPAAATQTFPAMKAPFAGGIAVLDVDADGYSDRLYAGDLQGSLWRFDLWQGHAPASLVTGGIFAALGGADPAAQRGFRTEPDVALVSPAGAAPWFSIGIGTRSAPAAGGNWFFLLRDHDPFSRWTQPRHDAFVPIRDSDLVLAGQRPSGAAQPASAQHAPIAGFRIPLGAGQVAAQSTTAAHVLFYTVVEQGAVDENPCSAAPPTAPPVISVHAVDVTTADAALVRNGDPRGSAGNSRQPLQRLRGDPRASVVIHAADAAGQPATRCTLAGVQLDACITLPPLTATFWRREDAD